MSPILRNTIIVGTFLIIALSGVFLSHSAPYTPSGDEVVILTGALQIKDGDLPDSYMLQAMDFGPYLYPKIFANWYETLGHYTFKSIYLIFLVLSIGLSAYIAFRLLLLPWAPSLLLAVVALMPRFSSGMEIFGALTFKEAIGRASATPLFFLATGLFFYRFRQKKSLWPVFALCGFLMFLHPVTVMLFTFVSLVAMGVTYIFIKIPIWKAIKEVLLCGSVYVVSGSYFFVEVLTRLSKGIASEGVDAGKYVEAIVYRNGWEFLPGSFEWYPHMGIVSIFFVSVIVLFYKLPALRQVRDKYIIENSKEILTWGITIAVTSLAVTIIFPTVNLYLMSNVDAPYIFQQWSRISKFYYLGIFIALVPVVHALWSWYLESKTRIKNVILVGFVGAAILSSSFFFEVAQFAIGYTNYTESYIPQSLSNKPDDITAGEYVEVCETLLSLGVTKKTTVLSNTFALRYYCKSNLHVTYEEGSAYQQLKRTDVVSWHEEIQAQRGAFSEGDPKTILDFAKSVNAEFVVVPKTKKYEKLETSIELERVITSKYIVLKVGD